MRKTDSVAVFLPRLARGEERPGGASTTIAMCVFAPVLLTALCAPLIQDGSLPYGRAIELVRQVTYVVGALLACYASLTTWRVSSRRVKDLLVKQAAPFVALIGYFWLTLMWSHAPSSSLTSLILASLVLCSFVVPVVLLRREVSERISLVVFLVISAICLLLAVVNPEYAFYGSKKTFRGMMVEKNVAGAVLGVTTILIVFSVSISRPYVRAILATPVVGMLLATRSRTAIASCILALGFGAAVGRVAARRADRPGIIPARVLFVTSALSILLLLGCVLALLSWTDIIYTLADNPEFMSSRGVIWVSMLEAFLEHPIVGVGYGAFWSNHEPSELLRAGSGNWIEAVAHGHNGYLDLAVQTGVVGLGLALYTVVAYPVAIWFDRSNDISAKTLPYALLAFCLVSNITESGLFDRDRVWSVVLIMSLGWLGKPSNSGKAFRR